MHERPSSELQRSLGLFALIAYGVGDILGAGIYALVGKVAGLAGNACWLSFLLSFIVALLTGFSYAELSSRFPRSGGESFYSLKAFKSPLLSYLVGFLVLMSSAVSMATVSHAFLGYVQTIWPGIPAFLVVVLFFLVLTAVNFWGMKESSFLNIICTAVELTGLFIVILCGLNFIGRVDFFAVTPPEGKGAFTALFQGGALAFYAFIGFEDMVKAAEESHQPESFIPLAILISLGVVAVFYTLTALAAVAVVDAPQLAASRAPLMLVVEKGFPAIPRSLFTSIALFAVANTALVNFVMGSRLLYGMATEGLAPSFLATVHPNRHTPHVAIGLLLLIALALSATGTLVVLAQSNSLILLSVYLLMNASLVCVKFRFKGETASFKVPIFIPVLGGLSSLGLIFFVDAKAFLTVAVLILLGLAFYPGLTKFRSKSSQPPL